MVKNILIVMGIITTTLLAQQYDRRPLDSLNTIIEKIRVNQTGYRTTDKNKKAMVELPNADMEQEYSIIDEKGKEVYSDKLSYIGDYQDLDGIVDTRTYYGVKVLYQFVTDPDGSEFLYEANFGDLDVQGEYRLVVENDTSYAFELRENVYNDVFELLLHMFGIQRSGDTDSWFHPKSNMMDGSARGPGKEGSLTGGWYDCGDHFKYSQTTAYTFSNLTLTYLFWPDKAEDRYGHSHADLAPHANDGIPDLLWEAKIGADFIYKLYVASVEDGLLENNDMYQMVGVSQEDHELWVKPEFRDFVPQKYGGPDRMIQAETGAEVAGQFAGALAFFAKEWEKYDRDYAKQLLDAAVDIYDRIVIPKLGQFSTATPFYPTANSRQDDDLAMAALGLWYATGDDTYKYDLMENEDLGYNSTAEFNSHEFEYGYLARHPSGLFTPGGWVSDYQNTHLLVLSAMYILFYQNEEVAEKWGIKEDERLDMGPRIINVLKKRLIPEGGSGKHFIPGTKQNGSVGLNVEQPYNLRWTTIGWGMNRYNMGGVIPVAMLSELFRLSGDPLWELYEENVVDNLDYVLGKNPWNMSFLIGAGEKNLQHIHHRGANPDGYNAGGVPYEYTVPTGAFMGGAAPGSVLLEDFNDFTVTETCIDYSSQLLLVSQLLSKKLPADTKEPESFMIIANPVEETTATIRWEFNELTNDSLFLYTDKTEASINSTFVSSQEKKMWELTNLQPDTEYWVEARSSDIKENRGEPVWHSFTTTENPVEPSWEGVDACDISHEAATIAWWSPGQFTTGGVYLGTSKSQVENQSWFIEGTEAAAFHEIRIEELEANTTYYFDRVSGSHLDDNDGKHYQFTTREAFVNYSMYVKPIGKKNPLGPSFSFEITNNEQKAYAGLEFHIYMTIKDFETRKPFARLDNPQVFDVKSSATGLNNFDTPEFVAVDADNDEYYLKVVINDTLPVAGRARFEIVLFSTDQWGAHLEFDAGNENRLENSWSFAPHEEPAFYGGLPWDKMDIYGESDVLEEVNGEYEISYALNEYIPVYYNGQHVYGYAPGSKAPKSLKYFELETDAPFFMESRKATIVTTEKPTLKGSVIVKPYGDISDIEINGQPQDFTEGQHVDFNFDVTKVEDYDPVTEMVIWSDKKSEECSYTYKKWIINTIEERPSSSSEEPSSEESSSSEPEESSSEEEEEEEEESSSSVPDKIKEIDDLPEIPGERMDGIFDLYFENRFYTSQPIESDSEDRISLDPIEDNHSMTMIVVDVPENPEDYTFSFIGYIYSFDGQYIDSFDIIKSGKELDEDREFSLQWNNRGMNGNLLDSEGRTLGSGIYILKMDFTVTNGDVSETSFLMQKFGYLRLYM